MINCLPWYRIEIYYNKLKEKNDIKTLSNK